MGSSSSKHTRRLEQISQNLNQIKEKIRNGQITHVNTNEYEKTVQSYKREAVILRQRVKQKSKINKVNEEIKNVLEQLRILNELGKCKNEANVSLERIQNGLETIKRSLVAAETGKDTIQIVAIQKNIDNLMTNLQMIDARNNLLNEEKKTFLEKNLVRLYKQATKMKKQIENEIKLQNVTNAEINASIKNLERIEENLTKIRNELQSKNLDESKNAVIQLKNRLDKIDEIDQRVCAKKSEIFDSILSLESDFTRLEAEAKLTQIEEKLARNSEENLEKIKQELDQILEVSKEIEDKKTEILAKLTSATEETAQKREEEHTRNEDETTEAVLEEVEGRLKQIASKVANFIGSENSEAFFELDDALIQATLKLDCLKLEKGSSFHQKKLSLLREINKLNDTLDERVTN